MFRIRQSEETFIYRYIAAGTLEENKYDRQVLKLSTSRRVLDEHQIDSHISASSVGNVWKMNLTDPILEQQIQKYHDLIYNCIEHDSLLETFPDGLSDAEKEVAMTEIEILEKSPEMMGVIGNTSSGAQTYQPHHRPDSRKLPEPYQYQEQEEFKPKTFQEPLSYTSKQNAPPLQQKQQQTVWYGLKPQPVPHLLLQLVITDKAYSQDLPLPKKISMCTGPYNSA